MTATKLIMVLFAVNGRRRGLLAGSHPIARRARLDTSDGREVSARLHRDGGRVRAGIALPLTRRRLRWLGWSTAPPHGGTT